MQIDPLMQLVVQSSFRSRICTLSMETRWHGLPSRCRWGNTIDDVHLGCQCSQVHDLRILPVSPMQKLWHSLFSCAPSLVILYTAPQIFFLGSNCWRVLPGLKLVVEGDTNCPPSRTSQMLTVTLGHRMLCEHQCIDKGKVFFFESSGKPFIANSFIDFINYKYVCLRVCVHTWMPCMSACAWCVYMYPAVKFNCYG